MTERGLTFLVGPALSYRSRRGRRRIGRGHKRPAGGSRGPLEAGRLADHAAAVEVDAAGAARGDAAEAGDLARQLVADGGGAAVGGEGAGALHAEAADAVAADLAARAVGGGGAALGVVVDLVVVIFREDGRAAAIFALVVVVPCARSGRGPT